MEEFLYKKTGQTFSVNTNKSEMPTLEERVSTLETQMIRVNEELFGHEPIVPKFTRKNYLRHNDKNVLGFPQAQVFYNINTNDYNLYLSIQRQAGANNYDAFTGSTLNNLTAPAPQLPIYSSVINSPKGLYSTVATWKGNPLKPYGQFWKFNSPQWKWELLKEETFPSGEDRGVFWCEATQRFVMYCRVDPYTQRKLGVFVSSDYQNWIKMSTELFPEYIPDSKRFYSANGFILNNRLHIVANILDTVNWTVYPKLYIAKTTGNFYASMPDSFDPYDLRLLFPELTDDTLKQLFVYPHVVGNNIVFTCIKCNEPHESPNNPTGIHWTEVWDIPKEEFLEVFP